MSRFALGLMLAIVGCRIDRVGLGPEDGGADGAIDAGVDGRTDDAMSGDTGTDASLPDGAIDDGAIDDGAIDDGAIEDGDATPGDGSVCGPCTDHAHCDSALTCACDDGYEGMGETCVDIDECARDIDECGSLATCVNTEGGYTCSCPAGFDSTSDGRSCMDIDECAREIDDCHIYASCTNSAPVSGAPRYSCTCNTGYMGDGVTCDDVDECVTMPARCDPNATCMNTMGSASCFCNAGWSGTGYVCVDVDECASGMSTCAANETCVDTDGAYDCACIGSFERDSAMVCQSQITSSGSIAIDGAPGACKTFDFESVSGRDLVIDAPSLEMTLQHTQVGDLTIQLTDPAGFTLTVMSRPGCTTCATSRGEDAGISGTVTFSDDAAVSSESMGAGLDDGATVCEADDICDFSPSGATGGEVTRFSGFVGSSIPGAWTLCVYDGSLLADTGTLRTTTLRMPR